MVRRGMVHRDSEVDQVTLVELQIELTIVKRITIFWRKRNIGKEKERLTWKRETSGERISSVSFFAGTNWTVIHD